MALLPVVGVGGILILLPVPVVLNSLSAVAV
jgi:hypothetical protein